MTSVSLEQALKNLREKYQSIEEETPLDRTLDAFTAWVKADTAAKWAGLWLSIGTAAFLIVAVFWMTHQFKMIGGF